MTGRDPAEAHRAATPLELLFDLCFVVAVAQAAAALHHDLAVGAVSHALFNYFFVFFAIWWPWVNFTWFASAYDTDDVLYRVLTFVQIAGVLIVAVGVPSAFEALDFRVMVVGYVIMRIALVGQWLRVAREDPDHRRTALRFAAAITVVQIGWVLRLALDGPIGVVSIGVLGALELLIPVWAESAGRHTPWHPGHVTERYGLFTIIVIGECVLAAFTAAQAAFGAGGVTAPLLAIAVGGLLLVFGAWWLYFKDSVALPHGASLRTGILWSYGHYVVFASIAALGAGLQVAIESISDHGELTPTGTALTIALPLVIYLVAIGVLHGRSGALPVVASLGPPIVAILALAAFAGSMGVPVAVLVMGLVLASLIVTHIRWSGGADTAAIGAVRSPDHR
jgi:low temperature requirement protein LtrA